MAIRVTKHIQPLFPVRFKRTVRLRNGREMVIRRMRSGDVEIVTELEHICFKDAWTDKHFRREVENGVVSVPIVAEINGEIVGYIVPWFIEDEIHIVNVAVSPLHRRQSIAKHLIGLVLQEGQKQGSVYAYLEVRISNFAAIHLYQKFGFSEAGIQKKYYQDEEDALVMEKYLFQKLNLEQI